MTKTKIIFTPAYEEALGVIEDFLFESTQEQSALEWFWNHHDQALQFVAENPTAPAIHPATGDQSWPFGDGRYRLFFKFNGQDIEMLDLIDNRMSNLKIYPNTKLPT